MFFLLFFIVISKNIGAKLDLKLDKAGTTDNQTVIYDLNESDLYIHGNGSINQADFYENVPSHEIIIAIAIGEGIISISNSTFSNCFLLERVSLANSTLTLGNEVFKSCIKLSSFGFAGAQVIGNNCFQYCSQLSQISLKSAVSIESEAFSGCSSLSFVVIGENLKDLDDFSFYNCTSLELIELNSENKNFAIDKNGILYSKDFKQLFLAPPNINFSFPLNDNVEQIHASAFAFNLNIMQINITESVKKIGRAHV